MYCTVLYCTVVLPFPLIANPEGILNPVHDSQIIYYSCVCASWQTQSLYTFPISLLPQPPAPSRDPAKKDMLSKHIIQLNLLSVGMH